MNQTAQKPKKAASWAKKHPALVLLAACYALALAGALLAHFGGFVANRIAFANGALATTELSVADFELVDLAEAEGGSLLSLSTDPQMHLRDTALRVADLEMEASYSKPPLMENAYWADEGEDWSVRRMAYRSGNLNDGTSTFRLPPTGGGSLRIDPGAEVGNLITIHRITANPKRPFYAFFIPSAGQAAALAILPGLGAGALSILWQAGLRPRARRARKDVTPDD